MQVYGLAKALETINIRELRGILSAQNKYGWQQLMRDARAVKITTTRNFFYTLRKNLVKFNALVQVP